MKHYMTTINDKNIIYCMQLHCIRIIYAYYIIIYNMLLRQSSTAMLVDGSGKTENKLLF